MSICVDLSSHNAQNQIKITWSRNNKRTSAPSRLPIAEQYYSCTRLWCFVRHFSCCDNFKPAPLGAKLCGLLATPSTHQLIEQVSNHNQRFAMQRHCITFDIKTNTQWYRHCWTAAHILLWYSVLTDVLVSSWSACLFLVSCYVAIADNSGEEFRDVKQDLVR